MMVVGLTMYMVQNPLKYDDVISEQPLRPFFQACALIPSLQNTFFLIIFNFLSTPLLEGYCLMIACWTASPAFIRLARST